MQTKLHIGGDFMTGAGQDLAILDPATGETIGSVSEASPEQINRAVAAAAAAFSKWSGSTPDRKSVV